MQKRTQNPCGEKRRAASAESAHRRIGGKGRCFEKKIPPRICARNLKFNLAASDLEKSHIP